MNHSQSWSRITTTSGNASEDEVEMPDDPLRVVNRRVELVRTLMGSKPERRSRDRQTQFGGDHNGDIARKSL